MHEQEFDVLVRGEGCVGRALALALSAQGLRVALLGRDETARDEDLRTYALNAASVALLRELRVWDALPPDAVSPVYEMQVQGDQAAGQLGFSAWQQGVGELAHIVDAAALEQQLAAALRFAPHVKRVTAPVPAGLEALCEGRDSAARAALGVRFERHGYAQTAIAARLVASEAHQGVARQWFRAPDVLALLPFERPEPQRSYGLVWSLPRERAEELLAAGPAEFESALLQATGGAVGPLALAGGRAAWPLAHARADRVSGPGWVLLGDAAHQVHPLAGQGLNLGFADVATLVRVLREREAWRPLGDERLLRRFARERAVPNWAMGELTDGLLRVFASEAPGLRELRNRGMGLLNHLPPVKRWLTGRALGA
ncbi:2-octaprenyl-3-methyl-6-methoxy-1,4-benzoquinol hydroxylase [Roseateles sp. DAIF2]|uniref:FAD-dependent monooxygenase n=1 Tax=Roseateles sp. DAIF2 TaxID=2714952 RepID=UPI0018A2D00A|nr:FAD-dependent monooxygenase [Roseateles sp. DAIF2]QPF72700.1 2-octaprenyl-3-methyl-6-methoxy-1,4-benzoquinol hydroxylase [Roseateles sp. DAIF2]